MADGNAQKSEVHSTSGDAETSPQADRGDRRSGQATTDATTRPGHSPERLVRPLDPPLGGMEVVSDDSDAGGPVVIRSEDPGLNPPHVPQDPFPTDRKPEIDPPV